MPFRFIYCNIVILPEILIGDVTALVRALVETVVLALNTETVHRKFPACLVLSVTVTFVTGDAVLGSWYCPAITLRERTATSTGMPRTWQVT